jgi:hypothetical protein
MKASCIRHIQCQTFKGFGNPNEFPGFGFSIAPILHYSSEASPQTDEATRYWMPDAGYWINKYKEFFIQNPGTSI